MYLDKNITIKNICFHEDGKEVREYIGMYGAMGRSIVSERNRNGFKYNYTPIPENMTLENYMQKIAAFTNDMETDIFHIEKSVFKIPSLIEVVQLKEKALPALKDYSRQLNYLAKTSVETDTLKNRGGMFLFPLQTKLNWYSVLNFVSAEYVAWMKHIYCQNIINTLLKIYKPKDCYGCTLGRDFSGKYPYREGQTFNERSVTIDCVGVDEDILYRIAAKTSAMFKQSPIIIKSFDSGKVYILEGKFEDRKEISDFKIKEHNEYFTEKEGIRYFNIEMLYKNNQN
jgi:hypothetical protein